MLFRDVIVALYRGLESKLIQTVLTSALMLATYEHIVSVIFLLVWQWHSLRMLLLLYWTASVILLIVDNVFHVSSLFFIFVLPTTFWVYLPVEYLTVFKCRHHHHHHYIRLFEVVKRNHTYESIIQHKFCITCRLLIYFCYAFFSFPGSHYISKYKNRLSALSLRCIWRKMRKFLENGFSCKNSITPPVNGGKLLNNVHTGNSFCKHFTVLTCMLIWLVRREVECFSRTHNGFDVFHSNLDFGQLRLWLWIFLERIKQSTSGKRRYQLCFFHVWWNNLVNFGQLRNKRPWSMTLKLNNYRFVWSCKMSSSWVQRFISYCIHKFFFALSRNGEKSDNSDPWPWALTYDLGILWFSCGCQGTCSRKISSSWMQRFTSYLANREKKLGRKQYSPSQSRGQ